MSVNFYDNAGWMTFVDLHTYVTAPLLPVPMFPHVAAMPNGWLSSTFWKRAGTVTSDAKKMIKGGFKAYLVTHVPLPLLPPSPAEPGELAMVILLSNSKAVMTVSSVTGEGGALATCLAGFWGLNMNCGTQMVGCAWNPNSVKTSPSLGDYLSAIVALGMKIAMKKLLSGDTANRLLPTPFWKKLVKKFVSKLVTKPLRSVVQKAVDGEL